jgi:hypothetical protein
MRDKNPLTKNSLGSDLIMTISCKPTFINFGPGRCATTWLFEVLLEHPQIIMANIKETDFFNVNYHLGETWYESHFPECLNLEKNAVGEISNNYYLDPIVAKRIRDYNPEIKLIINLRNPFELLISFYNFGLRRGLKLDAISQSLGVPIGQIMGSGFDYRFNQKCLAYSDCVSLLDSVLLAKCMTPFFENFESSKIYIFIYERLLSEPIQVLRELYSFLEVDTNFVPSVSEKIVNVSIYPKSKLIARYFSKLSFILRRCGANELLTNLHRSDLIKKVFYMKTDVESSSLFKKALPADAIRMIEEDIEQLKLLCPSLAFYWSLSD